jgi:hypothetical protein
MTFYLYEMRHHDPKFNAQRNLQGRTHYVDDDTLKYHKSRVLSTHVLDGGLLLAIVTSDSTDFHNKKREFRYAIFDVFGTCVARPELGLGFKSELLAKKAMFAVAQELNAVALTREGMASRRRAVQRDLKRLSEDIKNLKSAGKV